MGHAAVARTTIAKRNESVPNVMVNDAIDLFFKLQPAFCEFQTVTVSECCLIKLLPCILYFEKKNILIFCIGNGQSREPALCQLYRRTFVPYLVKHVQRALSSTSASLRPVRGRSIAYAKVKVAIAYCHVMLISIS